MHRDGPSVSAKTCGRAVARSGHPHPDVAHDPRQDPTDKAFKPAASSAHDDADILTQPGGQHQVPQPAARTIAALLAVRDQVIAPILAGVRVPRQGRPPKHLTIVDRDYEHLRVGMCTLFEHLGISTEQAAA